MEACQNCGAFVNEDQEFCIECGKKIEKKDQINESGSRFLFGLISFFIPLLGLVFWILLRGTKPKAAKTSIRWGIGGFFAYLLVGIFFILFYVFIIVGILT